LVRIALLITLLAPILAFIGCQADEEAIFEDSSINCQSTDLSLAGNSEVTFYGNIQPFLASQSLGETYKCTTCHVHYNEPSGVNSVSEVNAIIASIKNKSMPITGDRVKSKYITLLKQWRLAGFPEGKIGQALSKEKASGNTASTTSSGCN